MSTSRTTEEPTLTLAVQPEVTKCIITQRGDSNDTIDDPTQDPHALIRAGEKISEFNKKRYAATRIDYQQQFANGTGLAELHGGRSTQEDAVIVHNIDVDPNELSDAAWRQSLSDTVLTLEEDVEKDETVDSVNVGSCLLSTVVIGNKVHVANLGDSTAYFVTIQEDGTTNVELLHRLHDPRDEIEIAYIKANGGNVRPWPRHLGGGYLATDDTDTCLAVSRTIGDTKHKKAINHRPETYTHTAEIPDGAKAFILTACDGLTEKRYDRPALSEVEIGKIVQENSNKEPHEIAHALVTQARQRSSDNISAIVTRVDPENLTPRVAGVADGHAGHQVADFIREHFAAILDAQLVKQLSYSYLNELREKAAKVTAEQPSAAATTSSSGLFANSAAENKPAKGKKVRRKIKRKAAKAKTPTTGQKPTTDENPTPRAAPA